MVEKERPKSVSVFLIISGTWRKSGGTMCVNVCGSHRHTEQPDNEHIDLVQQRGKGQTSMY